MIKNMLAIVVIILSVSTISVAADTDGQQAVRIKVSGVDVSDIKSLPVVLEDTDNHGLALEAVSGGWGAKVVDYSSKNPLAGTTLLFYEATGAVTNQRILTKPAGTIVWVSKLAIHSMDIVNKGAVKFMFASDGTEEFYGGYIGTAPSGFGDEIYAYDETASAGIWVTTPGACKIIIHYKTGSAGP